MKAILSRCINGETLSIQEAEHAMDLMMTGKATPNQMASLLSILRFRGETVDELTGFLRSIRHHMQTIDWDEPVIDVCGTGGDGASTFNISTAAMLVVSSLGIPVAKHGNRAVSSKSGSADVLEKLQLPIQSTPEEAKQALKKHRMSFLFAPLYHQAMKHVVKPRKEIGFRTVFNMLGPLANPARSTRQVIGVFSNEAAYKMAKTLQQTDAEHVLFVTGQDGLDELTVTTATNIIELKDGHLASYSITPEEIGIPRGALTDLQVQSVEESAALIERVLQNEANESAMNIVLVNAGAAIYVSGAVSTIQEGVHEARKAITTGRAYQHFKQMQRKEERYAATNY
jgi:anthranilate phosphoribosyltransferase